MEINKIYNADCMEYMGGVNDSSFNLTLTDIPYGEVNRDSNGLRNLDKNMADVMTFSLDDFLNEVYRITSGTIIININSLKFINILKSLIKSFTKNTSKTSYY